MTLLADSASSAFASCCPCSWAWASCAAFSRLLRLRRPLRAMPSSSSASSGGASSSRGSSSSTPPTSKLDSPCTCASVASSDGPDARSFGSASSMPAGPVPGSAPIRPRSGTSSLASSDTPPAASTAPPSAFARSVAASTSSVAGGGSVGARGTRSGTSASSRSPSSVSGSSPTNRLSSICSSGLTVRPVG